MKNIFRDAKELLSSDLKIWFCIAGIFHFLAAILSDGYLHVDEHFQILEYMGHKLFGTPAGDLAWEYQAKMRPWIQHFFYFLFSKPLTSIGMDNPFILHTLYRICSALLGFMAIISLSLWAKKIFSPTKAKWTIILLNTIWFFPFLHARISSEIVGGSLFAICLALTFLNIDEEKKLKPSLALIFGLLFGISFLIRYHIGVMIFFGLTWAIFAKELKLKSYLLLSTGIAIGIGLGVIVDYWGYGSWTFAPLEYVKQNLYYDKASNYGVTPWWEYLRTVSKRSILPFGYLILISHFFVWIRRPKAIWPWLTLPFFLIHSAIPHKELRFLFPLMMFIPFILVEFFSAFPKKWQESFEKFHGTKGWKFIVVVNGILLVQASVRSAHTSTKFYKHTYKMEEKIENLAVFGSDRPFWGGVLKFHYYNFHYPKLSHYKDSQLNLDLFNNTDQSIWIFSNRGRHLRKIREFKNCELKYINYPQFLLDSLSTRRFNRSRIWALHKCTKK